MRKNASQERAQATVLAIVQAAAHILKRDGVSGLTTNHVAQAAGVSIGSLYQYFPNKEAIVVALIRDQLDQDEQHLAQQLSVQEGGLATSIPLLVTHWCEYNVKLAPLLRELLPLLPPLDQTSIVEERVLHMSRFFEAFLLRHPHELRPELLDAVHRRHALWIWIHAFRAALNAALKEHGLLQDPIFQAEMAKLCLRYFVAL
jgi:AcrR family transcriptional regulator